MNVSPFKYGTTVSANFFTNREKESEKLYNNLIQGVNTSIISPRRWGKTSLVEKVIKDINKYEQGCKTVLIDFFSVSCEEEFLEIFAKEVILASSSVWEDWVNSGRQFFKQLIPKFSVGLDPTNDFNISFDWVELKKNKDEILNLPETIAIKKKMKFIICLDEFQNLANFPEYDYLEKRMRANWQRHEHVTYCLYGSKRHMMEEIFNNSSKPFFRFGDLMILQKITKPKWIHFIIDCFEKTNKRISPELASLIPELMKNHSWYVQQLAHYIWQKTDIEVSKEILIEALQELINANSPLYQKEVEIISITQLNLLKAIANGETKFTSAKVMQQYKLGTPRNVSKNKAILKNNDIIHESEEKYEFLDPAFELWFNKMYFSRNWTDIF